MTRWPIAPIASGLRSRDNHAMTPADVARRFACHREGFFAAHRWLIALFACALVADAASTIRFMSAEAVDHEVHLAVRWVSYAFGPIAGPIVGALAKAAAGLTVAIYLRRWARHILIVASILSLWAAWFNV